MRKIYYKEGEHINNKLEYILNFLPEEDNYFPETYYKDNDFLQCRRVGRRSFDDIFWLFKSKFKTATKGELARIILDKKVYSAELLYCDSIYKLVVCNRNSDYALGGSSFINGYPIKYTPFFLQEELCQEGPSFEDIVKYATRSKAFNIKNVRFSLQEHRNKYLK